MTVAVRRLRCAIYTRKSTEEGLDQAFNSLDAQREACEAYILSQAGEGWSCLPNLYDDGGWSGGNMDRPAIKRLLEEISCGRIDVVVVYKVDRLTRSLMDFARIVEKFDTHKVSFVSVTQAFNTTTSMGRLTLNVLLSFAQFEREVTGERIRDKIAASKARGMWMGGMIPLGYDLGDRQLLVNEIEAEQVRHMFQRYLALGSIPQLAKELAAQGIHSKRWLARSGKSLGGVPFRCGAIAHILNNRIYLGEIVHKGTAHPGDHASIVETGLFDAVQTALAANRVKRSTRKTKAAACPLAGKLFDSEGQAMRPSFSYGRGRKMYRYYVSETLLPNGQIGNNANMTGSRLAAEWIEKCLVMRLAPLLQPGCTPDVALSMITKVMSRGRHLKLTLDLSPLLSETLCCDTLLDRARLIDRSAKADGATLKLSIELPSERRGKTLFAQSASAADTDRRGALAELVRTAHRKLTELNASPLEPQRHVEMKAPNNEWTRVRMVIGLLAPDIQKALLLGKAPADLCSERLLSRDLPLDWHEQRKRLGW